MTTPTSPIAAPELPKCPYCGKAIESPVKRTIIDRGWDDIARRQYVRSQEMTFCTDRCGSNFQMGCEG